MLKYLLTCSMLIFSSAILADQVSAFDINLQSTKQRIDFCSRYKYGCALYLSGEINGLWNNASDYYAVSKYRIVDCFSINTDIPSVRKIFISRNAVDEPLDRLLINYLSYLYSVDSKKHAGSPVDILFFEQKYPCSYIPSKKNNIKYQFK